MRLRRALFSMGLIASWATTSTAQTPPAAPATPPDDTPSIRLGVTLFPNYTIQTEPEVTDTDGNTVHRNAFDVSRAYLNVTGNISHVIAFRVTPDIARETNAASALAGSLVFRVKYAYAQTNLDEWVSPGLYARFGIQQTPYLDYMENIYRYRFQGTMFVERQGYFASADAGASFHYNFPSNYGDVHGGVFNGENYQKAEVNDQKDFMIRASVRPSPRVNRCCADCGERCSTMPGITSRTPSGRVSSAWRRTNTNTSTSATSISTPTIRRR